MSTHKSTRRNFLKTAAVSAGALTIGNVFPSTVLGANDRINFGVIGTGGMGTNHLKNLVNHSEDDNIKVVAVSDVYKRRLTNAEDISGGTGYMDYRKLLERKDVDAVLIATPDHWHSRMSIEAMDAGKHVYCEKPLTLNAEQAIEVRDAVRYYKKVFQVGPQRTSQNKYRKAREMIREGRLGKVTWAQGSYNRNNRGRSVFGSSTTRDDPVGPFMTGEDYIDWDMWLGHEWGLAPRIPWTPNRFFYFRGYFDYNGGLATDLLYHFLAPLLLAIVGENGEYPWRVNANGGLHVFDDGREVPDVFMMTVDYSGKYTIFLESVLTNEYRPPARIYGRYGTMEFTEDSSAFTVTSSQAFKDKFTEMNDGYEKIIVPGRPSGGEKEDITRNMEKNFIKVIREGGKLHCNVDLGCTTMVAIKMAVESYRQNKTMIWDAENEKMISS